MKLCVSSADVALFLIPASPALRLTLEPVPVGYPGLLP